MAAIPPIEVPISVSPELRRHSALDLACRIVPPGTPTSEVLSRAQEFETYLATGVRPSRNGGVTVNVHAAGFVVTVDSARDLKVGTIDAIRAAVEEVLA